MSVAAYLHLEEAGENVYMNIQLGQSMYREGIIFWGAADSPLSCLTYFSPPLGLDGDRDGGVWSRLLGKNDSKPHFDRDLFDFEQGFGSITAIT